MFASLYQRREAVKLLLAHGADVNTRDKDGKSALMKVCMLPKKDEEVEMVKLFLDRGADVNAKDNMGNTALTMASMLDHLEVAKLLLAKGADVNIEGVGYPMPYAKPEMAKLLKEYGAVDKPR